MQRRKGNSTATGHLEFAPYSPGARRPIPARDTRWAATSARWLAGRGVSPDAISVGSVAFAAAAGACFALTGRGLPIDRLLWTSGALLVSLRLLANMLDGMVAFRSGRASRVGELFNEVPDRISDVVVLVGLGFAAYSNETLGWAAACTAIFVAYVRSSALNAGAPADYRGPMAKQQRMAVVIVAAIVMSVAPTSVAAGIPALALALITAGGAITAGRRLFRAYRVLAGSQPGLLARPENRSIRPASGHGPGE